ncbi:MAG: 5-formyltetrahydrofolate cyclo-ligase [Candidatus Omnitrophica bacterium]|nr:5-formyltetrahydrofolate cyclo-ligase [Candidatus Omnitrophota bacterium]
MKKTEIRKKIKDKLKRQKKEEKFKKDEIIKEKLLSLSRFKEAKTVAFYVSVKGEVNTEALIDEALAMGKRVVVPIIVRDDLELREIKSRKAELAKGPYGIPQPAGKSVSPFPRDKVDVIIVPGIAFTRGGLRLGRGKGFYDKFLKTLPRRVKKIGLAYDLQIIEHLPTIPNDFPVDMVITN